jgi:hypothetical protein
MSRGKSYKLARQAKTGLNGSSYLAEVVVFFLFSFKNPASDQLVANYPGHASSRLELSPSNHVSLP